MQLYREGKGLFPAPVYGPADLTVDAIDAGPDVTIEENSLLDRMARAAYQGSTVRVSRYMALDPAWKIDPESTVRIPARLRNGAPLVIEKRFGKGRVAAVLTTADRQWNNWPQTMTFPVLMLELQGRTKGVDPDGAADRVGTPIDLAIDADEIEAGAAVAIRLPEGSQEAITSLERTATEGDDGRMHVIVGAATDASAGSRRLTDAPGAYRFQWIDKKGQVRFKPVVRNVAPQESDLKSLDGRALAEQLKGLDYVFHGFAELESQAKQAVAGFNVSSVLLYVLLGLLALEQILAYSLSYHPGQAEVSR
jgi:hypothetical protein